MAYEYNCDSKEFPVFRGGYQKLVRDVTDEQRGRRFIFNATLGAAAGWLFFRVARSIRMTQIWALYHQFRLRPP
jgi:hypothetical protein